MIVQAAEIEKPCKRSADEAAIVVEDVTSLERCREFVPAWRRLLLEDPHSTPFQSPEWLLSWCNLVHLERVLGFAVWRGEDLVGWLPGVRRSGRWVLMGDGPSDYLDILIAPGWGDNVRVQAGRWLSDVCSKCDRLELGSLRGDSLLVDLPIAATGSAVTEQERCPAVPLRTGSEPWKGVRPGAEAGLRRLARTGRVRFETADLGNFESFFDAFAKLHGLRWAARGETGVVSLLEPMLRDASRAWLHRGALRLHVLRWDQRILSTALVIAHHDTHYYFLGGFDPEFAAHSTGSAIVGYALRLAQQEGMEYFDFLRGRETYKYRWGAVDRVNWHRRVWSEGTEAL